MYTYTISERNEENKTLTEKEKWESRLITNWSINLSIQDINDIYLINQSGLSSTVNSPAVFPSFPIQRGILSKEMIYSILVKFSVMYIRHKCTWNIFLKETRNLGFLNIKSKFAETIDFFYYKYLKYLLNPNFSLS